MSLDCTAIQQKLQELIEQTRIDFLSLNSSTILLSSWFYINPITTFLSTNTINIKLIGMTMVKSEVTALEQKIESARLSFNSSNNISISFRTCICYNYNIIVSSNSNSL